MAPLRGHVYMTNFSPTRVHEERGVRPAVVVSPNEYNIRAGLVLICPVTSKRKGYPLEVKIETEKLTGVVLVDQIRSIDWQARPLKYLGELPNEIFAEIQAKLVSLVA